MIGGYTSYVFILPENFIFVSDSTKSESFSLVMIEGGGEGGAGEPPFGAPPLLPPAT